MATAAVEATTSVPSYKRFHTLSLLKPEPPAAVEFDPAIHLRYQPHKNLISMEEMGYPKDAGISSIGGSLPFRLFTDEAVEIMKKEILQPDIARKYGMDKSPADRSDNLAFSLRGYIDEAPFTKAAWTHPLTTQAVSEMAGVELEIVMDFEIAHCNIDVRGEEGTDEESAALNGKPEMPAIVGWHNDSYPFVCVLMLSDTERMLGGETFVQNSEGQITTIPGPRKGHACVLQGRYLLHLAPRPVRYKDRITMVTSYRPKKLFLKDETVLTTVRPENHNPPFQFARFYSQYISYKASYFIDHLQSIKDDVEKDFKEKDDFEKVEVMKKLKYIRDALSATLKEMVVPGKEEEYTELI